MCLIKVQLILKTNDTSLFAQKAYLRSNCIKSDIEGDIDMRNEYKIKNLKGRISIRNAAWKMYFDENFNDSSKLTTQVMLILLVKIYIT